MDNLLGRLAGGGNAQLGGLGALIGTLTGAGIYLNLSGVVLGLVLGLGIVGLLATLAALVARPIGTPAHSMPAATSAVTATASTAAFSGSSVVLASAVPPVAGLGEIKIEATETEAQLLAAGRYAEYHLAKAKRFMATQSFKEAAHQASASLAHGDLPEARDIYKAAKAAGR